ncbi:MAG: glycosyltransferase family 1 protein [Chitinophagales bacterium]
MRIGVNARFLLEGKLEGIGLFTHEVLKRLVHLMPETEFVFFFDRTPSEKFLYANNVKGVVLPPPARHPILWYWWFEHSIPSALKKYKIDLFFSSDGYLSLKTDVPTILTIHDLAFVHFKEHLPYLVHRYFNKYTPKFAEKAKHILTVSEFSKEDIIEQYGVKADKITVVGNGCDDSIRPLDEKQKLSVKNHYTNKANYFVYVGAIHPRKNIKGLLEAFDLFKQHYESNIKLVLVGRWAWKTSETKKTFSAMKFADDVISLGHLEREELSKVLGAALALVYPSFFEGFGIPLLEAMYAEVPVIASERSSLPEVTENAALYVNPDRIGEMGHAMEKMAKDYGLREHLIEEGRKQRQLFTWDKTANKVWEVIKRCK